MRRRRARHAQASTSLRCRASGLATRRAGGAGGGAVAVVADGARRDVALGGDDRRRADADQLADEVEVAAVDPGALGLRPSAAPAPRTDDTTTTAGVSSSVRGSTAHLRRRPPPAGRGEGPVAGVAHEVGGDPLGPPLGAAGVDRQARRADQLLERPVRHRRPAARGRSPAGRAAAAAARRAPPARRAWATSTSRRSTSLAAADGASPKPASTSSSSRSANGCVGDPPAPGLGDEVGAAADASATRRRGGPTVGEGHGAVGWMMRRRMPGDRAPRCITVAAHRCAHRRPLTADSTGSRQRPRAPGALTAPGQRAIRANRRSAFRR